MVSGATVWGFWVGLIRKLFVAEFLAEQDELYYYYIQDELFYSLVSVSKYFR